MKLWLWEGAVASNRYQISLDEDDDLRTCTVKVLPQSCDVLFDKRKLLGRLLAIRECFNTSNSDVAPMALEADKRII